MSKTAASVSPSSPVVRRRARAAPPDARADNSPRENDIRWVKDLLGGIGMTPPSGFAAKMRAAQSDAEAEDLVSDQVQRVIRAFRAEKKAEENEAGSRGG